MAVWRRSVQAGRKLHHQLLLSQSLSLSQSVSPPPLLLSSLSLILPPLPARDPHLSHLSHPSLSSSRPSLFIFLRSPPILTPSSYYSPIARFVTSHRIPPPSSWSPGTFTTGNTYHQHPSCMSFLVLVWNPTNLVTGGVGRVLSPVSLALLAHYCKVCFFFLVYHFRSAFPGVGLPYIDISVNLKHLGSLWSVLLP